MDFSFENIEDLMIKIREKFIMNVNFKEICDKHGDWNMEVTCKKCEESTIAPIDELIEKWEGIYKKTDGCGLNLKTMREIILDLKSLQEG